MHLIFSLASRYKDIPDGRSSNASQYKNRKAGALWTLQGATESNSSPSRAKGHGQTRQTATKKSPLDRSRFISTAEKVINYIWVVFNLHKNMVTPTQSISVQDSDALYSINCLALSKVVGARDTISHRTHIHCLTHMYTPLSEAQYSVSWIPHYNLHVSCYLEKIDTSIKTPTGKKTRRNKLHSGTLQHCCSLNEHRKEHCTVTCTWSVHVY